MLKNLTLEAMRAGHAYVRETKWVERHPHNR